MSRLDPVAADDPVTRPPTPGYELTERQQKVARWLSVGLALSILPATAIANLTESWLACGSYRSADMRSSW
jgi:hypothetical protein